MINGSRIVLTTTVCAASLLLTGQTPAESETGASLKYRDPAPQHYRLTARASAIDSRVRPHPEIGFVIESTSGKPADVQHAAVDTRVPLPNAAGEAVLEQQGILSRTK